MFENLKNKKIILGITGGIAAYKACELIRLLIKNGAEVKVIMTEAAQKFVTPLTFEILSGKEVYTDMFERGRNYNPEHISLSRWADCILIAPATANTIAKIANGIADNLLSTVCLSKKQDVPLLIAPAMNIEMWLNPATENNIRILKERGIMIFGPGEGVQACGEIGLGRMLEPLDLAERTAQIFVPPLFLGKKIVITAGPTRERIDPVRYISNDSSGKMGYAIAQAAVRFGADVILVSGPTSLSTPLGVTRINVESAQEMYDVVRSNIPGCDIFIATAAVADFRPEHFSEQKIKKRPDINDVNIHCVKNSDILVSVANMEHPPLTVGFAAETENIMECASVSLSQTNIKFL